MKNITPQQLQPSSGKPDETTIHIPVLLEDVVRLLHPQKGETYLDLTAGYAGHASKIIEVVGPVNATLVDRDMNAIRALAPYGDAGTKIIHSDFAHAAQTLRDHDEKFDMVLVDLGVSSPQLDRPERGFSIQRDGPLDMRMDETQQRTAADIVNKCSERELITIIETYGEERTSRARTIARAIVRARPIRTTHELAKVILSSHRGGYQKIHPATRTFQAIRIALNDELGQIKQLLELLPALLRKNGRVVVISFHSLEDRLIKQCFAEQSQAGYEAELVILTKKPILGSINDVHNPRARSAVLRAAVKK